MAWNLKVLRAEIARELESQTSCWDEQVEALLQGEAEQAARKNRRRGHASTRLASSDREELARRVAGGESKSTVARSAGVSRRTVQFACQGRRTAR